MRVDIGLLLHTITTDNRKYRKDIERCESLINSERTNYDNSMDRTQSNDKCIVTRCWSTATIGLNVRKIRKLEGLIGLNNRIYDRIFMRRIYNILKKMN